MPVWFNITCCINLGMDGCELESVYRLMLSLIFSNGEDYIELFVSVTGQMLPLLKNLMRKMKIQGLNSTMIRKRGKLRKIITNKYC